MTMELTLTVVAVCLLLEAFFSGSEMAVVSASRSALRRKAGEGDRAAKLTLEFIEQPQRLLATTLLILGEITPKTLFQQHADRWVTKIIYPLRWASIIFTPLVFVLGRV